MTRSRLDSRPIVAVVEKYSMLKRNTTLLPQHCDSIGRERPAFFTGNQ